MAFVRGLPLVDAWPPVGDKRVELGTNMVTVNEGVRKFVCEALI